MPASRPCPSRQGIRSCRAIEVDDVGKPCGCERLSQGSDAAVMRKKENLIDLREFREQIKGRAAAVIIEMYQDIVGDEG
jgi:hypothetical protein